MGRKSKGEFLIEEIKRAILQNHVSRLSRCSFNQLRQMLDNSRPLVYKLVTTHKIESLKIGKSFRIPKVCVTDYIIENFGNLERITADEINT